MFFYLYNDLRMYIKFETKRGSFVFLTGSYDHALSFSGWKHGRFFFFFFFFFTLVRHFVETLL